MEPRDGLENHGWVGGLEGISNIMEPWDGWVGRDLKDHGAMGGGWARRDLQDQTTIEWLRWRRHYRLQNH